MSRFDEVIERARRLALEGVAGVPPLPVADRAAKSGAHVVAGHLARDAGDALEKWLAEQHKAAAAAGIAHVRKVGAPVVVGRGGRPVEWAGRGPADYQGVMVGGRALALEAKSLGERARISRVDIPEHQRRDLEAVERLGGLALLVVEVREAQLVAAVPWTEVPWRVSSRVLKRGTPLEKVERSETVGAEELEAWRVVPGCYLRRWA